MKKLFLLISLCSLFLMTACLQNVNFVPLVSHDSTTAIVTVNVDGNGRSTKTALPEVDYSQIAYKVYAEDSSNNKVESVSAGTFFQLSLSPGAWTVYAEGYYNDKLLSKGSSPVTVDGGGQYSVSVTTNLVSTGTGDVRLKVAGFQWYGSAGEIRYQFEDDAVETTITAVPGENYGLIERTGLTTGVHEVTLSYYAVSGAGAGYLLYRTREIINVLPDLTVNSWSSDSGYVTGTGENSVFTITTAMLVVLQSTTFYVADGSGMLPPGDDNLNRDYTGSYTKPFQSIETALERIKTVFPGSTNQFTIYVDGDNEFTEKITIESGMKIKIASYLSIRQATFGANNVTAYQILVEKGAKLTLENVTVQSYGVGSPAVLVKKDGNGSDTTKNGQFFIEGKCIIRDNYDSSLNNNVYLEDGCLIGINGLVTGSKVGVRTETAPTAADSPVYFTNGFTDAYRSGTGDKASVIFFSDDEYTVGTLNKSGSIYEAAMGFSSGKITQKIKDDVRIAVSKNHHVVGYGNTTVSASAYVNGEKYTGSDCSWKVCLQASGVNVSEYTVATNSITIPSVFPEGSYGIYVEFTYNGNVYSDTVPFSCFKDEIVQMTSAPAAGTTLEIKSQAALEKIRAWSAAGNDLKNVTIKLDADLIVDDYAPMGHSTVFNGTFDGNGKSITINSFSEVNKSDQGYGLFVRLSTFGKVKNLTLKGDINVTGSCAPFVSGSVRGTIENCVNECNVTATEYAAGIVKNNSSGTAGISVYNCINKGNISGKLGAGGISVLETMGCNVNCINEGNITSENGYAGGIANGCYQQIVNCCNKGEVTGKYAGGIVGSLDDSAGNSEYHGVINCYNTGAVSGTQAAGGIAGVGKMFGPNNPGRICIINNHNIGTVTSGVPQQRGGILGCFEDTTSVKKIENNYYLKVTGDDSLTGIGSEIGDNEDTDSDGTPDVFYCNSMALVGTDYKGTGEAGTVVDSLTNYVNNTLKNNTNYDIKQSYKWKKAPATYLPVFDN